MAACELTIADSAGPVVVVKAVKLVPAWKDDTLQLTGATKGLDKDEAARRLAPHKARVPVTFVLPIPLPEVFVREGVRTERSRPSRERGLLGTGGPLRRGARRATA